MEMVNWNTTRNFRSKEIFELNLNIPLRAFMGCIYEIKRAGKNPETNPTARKMMTIPGSKKELSTNRIINCLPEIEFKKGKNNREHNNARGNAIKEKRNASHKN